MEPLTTCLRRGLARPRAVGSGPANVRSRALIWLPLCQGRLEWHGSVRGLASRYDKHALVYRGGVVLAAIVLWLS